MKWIFARHDKSQWTWYANAVRQALADKQTPDDLSSYFKATPYTTAPKTWRETHPKKSAKKSNRTGSGAKSATGKPVFVAITCELGLPEGVKITEKGMMVLLAKRDGKPGLLIQPQAKRKGRGKSAAVAATASGS